MSQSTERTPPPPPRPAPPRRPKRDDGINLHVVNQIVEPGLCVRCGACEPACPVDIIRFDDRQFPYIKATIFRIAREALHNIARHSKADRIQVSLGSDCEGLSLSIRDNGEGFDPEELKERPQGMGLPGMKGRTELSGGLFSIRTERGRGTSLSFTWPHFKLLQTPQADAEIPTGGAKA